MSTESRKQKHKENLKTLIIEKAIGIIMEKGYSRFTIRLLAESIDYSPRTIYLYFKNKEDLLHAIIENVFSETVEVMTLASRQNIESADFFRSMINRHIRNALSNPSFYKAVIQGINSSRHMPSESEKRLSELLSHILKKCVKPALKNDTEKSVEILLGSLRSTSVMLINKGPHLGEPEIQNYIELYTDIILRGLT